MPARAKRSTAVVRIGGVDYPIPLDPRTKAPRQIEYRLLDVFPAAVAQQAQRGADNYGLNLRLSITGPFGIGQRQGKDPTRGHDQENVVTWWPGQITRGPQKQTPTWGGPTTFKVPVGSGFYESSNLGKLYLFGSGASADDEPVHQFVGSTATWTDDTLNGDLAGDVKDIVGMVDADGNKTFAIGSQLVDSGGNNKILYECSSVGVWSFSVSAAESFPIVDRVKFLIRSPAYFFTLGYVAATNQVYIHRKAGATTEAWSHSHELPSTGLPRGAENFPGPDGDDDMMFSTNIGLYYQDYPGAAFLSTPERKVKYAHPSVATTGILAVLGQNIYYADGPNVGCFKWSGSVSGQGTPVYIGPQDRADRPWSGLVSGKQGNVVSLAAGRTPGWLIVGYSGVVSGKSGTIMLYNQDMEQWFIPYKNSTSQRAINAIHESAADDDEGRVHFVEEQAAAGDQDPQFFDDLFTNPLEDSGWKYAAGGVITDSERDLGFGGLIKKRFFTTQLDADDLSASNETVGFEHAHDGGAYNTEQTINSNTDPARAYTDGSSTAVGTKAKRQQVRVNIDGTAGATPGPTIKSWVYIYDVPPEKPDGTPALAFGVPILLSSKSFKDNKDLGQTVTDIETLAVGALTTIRVGPKDRKVIVEGLTRFGGPRAAGVTVNTQPELPGEAILSIREVGE